MANHKVSFFGLGLMGAPMAEHLINRNKFDVTVWNRTAEKARHFAAGKKAHVAETPEEAISRSDILITMMWDFDSIKTTLSLGSDKAGLLKGKTLIQMSTVSPPDNKKIGELIVEAGGIFVEAPVLGTATVAQSGQLQILVGTTHERFGQVKDLLSSFGPKVRHIGDVGKASAMKLALNQMVGGEVAIFATSLAMVMRQDLPVDTFMEFLRGSHMWANYYDLKVDSMKNRDYKNPLFTTAACLKDFSLIVKECKKLGIDSANAEGTLALLQKATEKYADLDFGSIFDIVNPPK